MIKLCLDKRGVVLRRIKRFFPVILLSICPCALQADDTGIILSELQEVHETVQQFCGGISDRISKISGVSKANTAVSAVGTVAAGGALATGLAKAEKDKKIEKLSKEICDVGGCDPDKLEAMSDEEFFNTVFPRIVALIEAGEDDKAGELIVSQADYQKELQKSKNLGNWRTGLLAGTVGTNVASAIISGLNKDQSDLIQQVVACNSAVDTFGVKYNEAISLGVNPVENAVMALFKETIDNCGVLQESDVEKIEKRMNAVMSTSIAGAAVGAVGMGTSIAANTETVRNDNSDSGKKKEKNLNTVSNVAAGLNVAAGGLETGLNASLIVLTKKLMRAAEQCEGTF